MTENRGQRTEGIEFRIPHSLRGVGPYGPYGFRLVDRAYSSERPEAAFLIPPSLFRLQMISSLSKSRPALLSDFSCPSIQCRTRSLP